MMRRPISEVMRLALLGVLLAPSGLAAQSAAPPPSDAVYTPASYRRLSLPVRHELADLEPFDLNGDGLQDLVVVEADRTWRDIRHFVSVFLQSPRGFRPQPSALAERPPGLALAGVGRFRQGPGLALLTPGQVTVWPWRGNRFDPAAAVFLAVGSLFPVDGGELKTRIDWVADLNGDGYSELIVPRFDGLAVVEQRPDGALEQRWVLRIRPRARLLNYFRRQMMAYDLPAVYRIDVDGDGRPDLVTYQDGLLDIFLLPRGLPAGEHRPSLELDFQPPEPFDPKVPWDPPLLLVDAQDLNGDGRPDLVFSKNGAADTQFNTKTTILVYYGQPGQGGAPIAFSPDPKQVFPSEGFTLPLLLDLNKDGRIDLVMVNVEIGFWNVIKALIARSVSAQAAFYLMPASGAYPGQPTELESYNVKFSLGRFSHKPLGTFGDLNGDGLPDLLLSEDKERLGIHWGYRNAFWDTSPQEVLRDYLPALVTRIRIGDLNGDRRDDLIFLYDREDIRLMPEVNHTFTVLLSREPPPSSRTANEPSP
jgi:hypothetical protein